MGEGEGERGRRIGEHGRPLLAGILARKTGPSPRVNVLTHCNAGWLACVRPSPGPPPLHADPRARRGDGAKKIGPCLTALAARDNGLPFYVALPTSTIDWDIRDGLREIPIEE